MQAESALLTEALAVKAGVKSAVEHKYHRVVLERDSLLVHKELTATGKRGNWKLKPIIRDIQQMLSFIPENTVCLIRRNANKAADWVASQALKSMCFPENRLRLP